MIDYFEDGNKFQLSTHVGLIGCVRLLKICCFLLTAHAITYQLINPKRTHHLVLHQRNSSCSLLVKIFECVTAKQLINERMIINKTRFVKRSSVTRQISITYSYITMKSLLLNICCSYSLLHCKVSDEILLYHVAMFLNFNTKYI